MGRRGLGADAQAFEADRFQRLVARAEKALDVAKATKRDDLSGEPTRAYEARRCARYLVGRNAASATFGIVEVSTYPSGAECGALSTGSRRRGPRGSGCSRPAATCT